MKINGFEFKDIHNELPQNGSRVLFVKNSLDGYLVRRCSYNNGFNYKGIPILFVEFWRYDDIER